MTEHMPPAPIHAECLRFEEHLMAYLERELADVDREWMDLHRAGCARCEAMVRDIDALVAEASSLSAIAPSRDLWDGIAERLDAPVVALYGRTPVTPISTPVNAASGRSLQNSAGRGVSVRWFAIAATVLVTVSSAVTWRVARNQSNAADAPAVAAGARTPDTAGGASDVVLVANAADVYEQEIVALRTIVDQRFDELDSATVVVLKRNLEIIDRAIEDSREALAKDPNSRVLSSTLDRALESKLDLMRRLALL